MRVADGPGRLGLAHRPARPALHSPHPGPSCLEWPGAPPLRPVHLPGSHWTAQVTDSAGGPLRAAFHLSPKADAVFSNSTICFLPPLCLFIYLLLVLKTKIVFLFSALEAGGQMEELCVQRQDQVVPGVCVCLCVGCGVCEPTGYSVPCALCV